MRFNRRFWTLALLPLVILAGGCARHIPPAAAKPATPPIVSPMPSFAAMNNDQPRAPVSQIPVRVKTDLTPVQNAIRDAIPERFTETGHPFEIDYRWTLIRSGEPHIRIQDGLVAIHAEYKGEIESRGGPDACHLNPVYTTMDATGKIVLVQDREGLSFAFEPSQIINGLKPDSDEHCAVFSIPLKDQLPELVGLPRTTTALSQAVRSDKLAIPFQRLWDDLEGPLSLPIASLNTRACLYGNPREVSLGNQTGTTQETVISGVAKEMPVIIFEQTCTDSPPTVALMKAGPGATSAADTNEFAILAKVPISYAVYNLQLQSKLFHQRLLLDPHSAETTNIERVTASDANGRVLFAVDINGDLNGTIYYWGTPRLDDGGGSLSIPDLQMANESKTAIDTVRVGYWQIVDRELNSRLRQAARIELSTQVDRMKQAVMGAHSSGNLTWNVLVTKQQPDQALSTPQGLLATILLQGTASVTGRMTLEDKTSRASFKQGIQ